MIACEITNAWTMKDLLTPLIAFFGTAITLLQWQTSKIKVQHDLFERRFAVYAALIDYLQIVVVKGICGRAKYVG
jgi:hypothetical protein